MSAAREPMGGVAGVEEGAVAIVRKLETEARVDSVPRLGLRKNFRFCSKGNEEP